jgi:hypothetical protein
MGGDFTGVLERDSGHELRHGLFSIPSLRQAAVASRVG